MRIRNLAAALAVPALVAVLALPAAADPIGNLTDGDVPALAEKTQDGDVTGERRKCRGKKGHKRGEARTGEAGERRRGKRRGRKGRRGKRKGQSDADE